MYCYCFNMCVTCNTLHKFFLKYFNTMRKGYYKVYKNQGQFHKSKLASLCILDSESKIGCPKAAVEPVA